MDQTEELRLTDAAVIARYLQLRCHLQDHILVPVEERIESRYDVQPTRRQSATLTVLLHNGFLRPDEGEIWPVVFLTPVNITLALCIQLTAEKLAALGTVVNGPRPIRQRHWEDWWGWEATPAEIHPRLFQLMGPEQEELILTWYEKNLDWLARNGLMARKQVV
jgi:hypothetical protein